MTTLEELERRLAAVEAKFAAVDELALRLRALEQRRVTEAAVEALAGPPPAYTELLARESLLQRLAAVEAELGGRFDVVDRHLDEADLVLAAHTEALTAINGRLDAILARLPEPPS